ncbi:uncharacterized protein CLUP02_01254 [Colletotrichum lupini]|uniref:Uncharacterized protein n=1 Tax=Colletotrichum lupini TaxID=145971 RepID=A0A9Q8W8H8_9PEZI|nr:uncharacterized protein CLUP02_01254 [Colletotrichum lupini]UQC74603.1 hypothetical protein CLUP02_01254 [Colletotrichum lupini]
MNQRLQSLTQNVFLVTAKVPVQSVEAFQAPIQRQPPTRLMRYSAYQSHFPHVTTIPHYKPYQSMRQAGNDDTSLPNPRQR